MEQDELLKRVLMMQRLQGMETEPISAEDPYASMEKDQLIRDTHKQDVKTQTNLLKSIDRLTNQVADLTTQNRMISERIAELAQTLPSRD